MTFDQSIVDSAIS